jgi:hypothetical protein
MKAKYLTAAIVAGTVLLTSHNCRKSEMPLERSVQTPTTQTAEPNDPNKDPNDYDPNSNMKAIIEPRDELYNSRKSITF